MVVLLATAGFGTIGLPLAGCCAPRPTSAWAGSSSPAEPVVAPAAVALAFRWESAGRVARQPPPAQGSWDKMWG
jgi:hypothetical protein